MTSAEPGAATVHAVVVRTYPATFAQELGIADIGAPSRAFRLLVMALLMSARIRASVAQDAARALSAAGWRTAASMNRATWAERTSVLNRAGYARFDESTSRQLGDTSAHLLEAYRGDLRRMREAAGGDPRRLRRLLKECKGVGDVGADIFLREAQATWVELHPFVDERAARAADRLGLPTTAEGLSRLAGDPPGLALLLSGIVRADLDRVVDQIRATPRPSGEDRHG